MSDLARLTRTLQEETERWARIETGGDVVIEPAMRSDHGPDETVPYAATFRVRTFDARGAREFTVVVTESHGL